MANPGAQAMIDEDVARQAEEQYARLEAELQEMRQQNEALNPELQQQNEVSHTEHLLTDRRSRAQMQNFANMTAELLAGKTRT